MSDDDVDSFFDEMLQEEQNKVKQVGALIQAKEVSVMKRIDQATAPKQTHLDWHATKPDPMLNQSVEQRASDTAKSSDDQTPNETQQPSTAFHSSRDPQEFLQSVQRDLNRLSSGERSHRLASMRKLVSLFRIDASFDENSLAHIHHLFRFVYSVFIKALEDDMEAIRENSCLILIGLYHGMLRDEGTAQHQSSNNTPQTDPLNDIDYSNSNIDLIHDSLSLLIPVLASRLQNDAHTNQPHENSEEVRKLMMDLFLFLLSNFDIVDYLNPVTKIIKERLSDNFHTIKKLSCESIVLLFNNEKYKRFLDNNTIITKLINSLTPNLSHQRHYVRAECVLALNELIMVRPGGESLKDLAKVIRKLASDNSKVVRENLLETCENWFLNHQDMYSFQDIFITPILIMHSDELDDLRQKAISVMDRLGQKHEEWNEEKLKDQLEYVYEDVSETMQYLPKPLKQRPRLGSRLIVKHNFKKLLELVQETLSEWSVTQKEIYAQLLLVLIIYTEKDITQHMDKMLQMWFKVVQDDELSIREYLQTTIRAAGSYVEPDAYLPHIFSFLQAQYATSPHTLANVLLVLSVILEHITAANLKILANSYKQIADILQASHLVYHEDKNVVSGVFEATNQILSTALGISEEDGYSFFVLIHKAWSQPSNSQIAQKHVVNQLTILSKKTGQDKKEDLYKLYLRKSVDELITTSAAWDKSSNEMLTFSLIAKEGIQHAPEHSRVVFKHIKDLTQKGQDATVVATMFSIMEHMFHTVGDEVKENVEVIVNDIIGNNLPWRSGKAKLRTRILGLSCLNVILEENLCTDDQLKQLVQNHHKSIVSTLDEFAEEMRILSTRVHSEYIVKVGKFLSAEQWHDTFKVLVELLDDQLDEVRVQVIRCLSTLFEHVPYEVRSITSQEAFEKFMEVLFLHLDDENREVQMAVFETMDGIRQRDNQRANWIDNKAKTVKGRQFQSPHTKHLLEKLEQ